jgi:hypothetical protein
MKRRDRMSQSLRVRSASKTVPKGRFPSGFALSSAPFGVSPSPWRRGESPVPRAVLVKSLPPKQELPVESPEPWGRSERCRPTTGCNCPAAGAAHALAAALLAVREEPDYGSFAAAGS